MPLWTPSHPEKTQMADFMEYLQQKHQLGFSDYQSLYRWSVSEIPQFWGALWDFLKIKAQKPYEVVVDDPQKMPGARWFVGAKINFAENLLSCRDQSTALIFRNEKGQRETLSYKELYGKVASLAYSLKEIGIEPGDRVAGLMANTPEAVIAMLATTAIGAVWTSCSPDFGLAGVLDRFGQIEPRVLFASSGYSYKGVWRNIGEKISQLVDSIPSLEKVVVVDVEGGEEEGIPKGVAFSQLISQRRDEIPFVYRGFDHPVYIMYSSGTTGLPKCIVQGAGVLINHLKELVLHCDLRKGDRIFYFTTCGWMMWNWLVSALGVGATVVLYDGHPLYPSPQALWQMAQEEELQIFGTSASYLTTLEALNVEPIKSFDLPHLRTILSTGSPLSRGGFEYVYGHIKEDVQLASISGGTDLNGCFALGCPILPVYAGEIQCRGLAMKVEIFDDKGQALQGEMGELVCTAPFPSMPLTFWKDPEKYRRAYFDRYPGVWHHGDFARITERGGVIISGRSDATLNPGGVRIGTAEIYRVVEGVAEVEDSVAVGQPWKGGERVVLFVKLKEGETLTEELGQKICKIIGEKVSPRHMPAKVVVVPDIPYTINMKKVEVAVKNILRGGGEHLKNPALKNPESLEAFRNLLPLE